MNRRDLLLTFCLATVGLAVPGMAFAQTGPSDRKPKSDKPFAEHFLALQLSDSDPKKERLVLSVASNIMKFYGTDRVAVEVVAFGPGINLLRDNNQYRALVDSLVVQGVKFNVCGNTLDTIERETGKRPKMNPHAIVIEAGVERLLTLAESGYTIVRP